MVSEKIGWEVRRKWKGRQVKLALITDKCYGEGGDMTVYCVLTQNRQN